MPEKTKFHSDTAPEDDEIDQALHTCACGEQHRHETGSPSHRDSCTSPKKFGNSCCCGPQASASGRRHECGHGPRCR